MNSTPNFDVVADWGYALLQNCRALDELQYAAGFLNRALARLPATAGDLDSAELTLSVIAASGVRV